MGRFGEDPQGFFEAVYRGTAPWDVGMPQPAVAGLFQEFPPQGPLLDVGCGSGDHLVFASGLGLAATGLEFVASAAALARGRLAGLDPLPEVVVGDGLRPSLLGRTFRSVLDSGFYHLFDRAQGEAYAAELAAVLPSGGRLYLLEFAIEFDIPNAPRGISEAELREVFSEARGWKPLAVRPVSFANRVAATAAVAACFERI